MSDTSKGPRSMYDAPLGEVAIKHFFAGMMQGLGGLVVTLISWVLIYVLVVNIVLPQISGMLTQAEGLMKSLEKIQGTGAPSSTNLMVPQSGSKAATTGGTIAIPAELLQQVQRSLQQQ
ncbi:MAG: hypothetical protein ABI758_00935 [Candidatus Woesebacteria bacterium]